MKKQPVGQGPNLLQVPENSGWPWAPAFLGQLMLDGYQLQGGQSVILQLGVQAFEDEKAYIPFPEHSYYIPESLRS